jgi:hypothetical protein
MPQVAGTSHHDWTGAAFGPAGKEGAAARYRHALAGGTRDKTYDQIVERCSQWRLPSMQVVVAVFWRTCRNLEKAALAAVVARSRLEKMISGASRMRQELPAHSTAEQQRGGAS